MITIICIDAPCHPHPDEIIIIIIITAFVISFDSVACFEWNGST